MESDNGVQTDDRAKWRHELQLHYEQKYSHPAAMDTGRQLRQIVAKVRAHTACGTTGTLHTTLAACAKLAPGKSGGSDKLVAEIILCVPFMAVRQIHDLSIQRFKGNCDGEPECWRGLIIIFLSKCKYPKSLEHVRGITLISMFAKWHMTGIM